MLRPLNPFRKLKLAFRNLQLTLFAIDISKCINRIKHFKQVAFSFTDCGQLCKRDLTLNFNKFYRKQVGLLKGLLLIEFGKMRVKLFHNLTRRHQIAHSSRLQYFCDRLSLGENIFVRHFGNYISWHSASWIRRAAYRDFFRISKEPPDGFISMTGYHVLENVNTEYWISNLYSNCIKIKKWTPLIVSLGYRWFWGQRFRTSLDSSNCETRKQK